MLKIYLLTATLILSFNSASGQFADPIFLTNTQQKTVTQIGCADFTNDGQPDILSSHHFFPNHLLNLYVQTTNSQFTEQSAIQDSLGDINSFAIGDINSDSWNDIVLSHHWPSSILWYENVNGTFVKHIVDTALDITQKVLLADLDQNNKPDIISLQHVEIVIYLANNSGGFDTARVIHDGTEFYDIDVADYNQDGFKDVAVASSGFEILVNDGNGNFSLLPKNGNEFTFGLRSGDLDQDNDNDIVSYVSLSGLVFYKNDGSGAFTSESMVLSSVDNFLQYGIIDMDCDNINDVYTTIPQQGHAVWIENLGNSQFSDPHIIYTQPGEIVASSMACDVNNDATPDFLWGNFHFGLHLNECTTTSNEAGPDTIAIEVYPNPTIGELVCHNTSSEKLSIILLDYMGRTIIQGDIPAYSQEVFHLKENGFYFLHARKNGIVKKIMKLVKME